jgi:hypothetical protein
MNLFVAAAQALTQAIDVVDTALTTIVRTTGILSDLAFDARLEAEAAYYEQLYTTAEFRADLCDQDAPFEDYN